MRALTPFMKQSGFNATDVFPEAIAGATIKGKVYGMPFGWSNRGFIVSNGALFSAAGMRPPTNATSFDDLAEMGKMA